MTEALDRLDATLSRMPFSHAARLPWGEKCGAFYALYRGFPKSLIAEAFAITPTTASFLANCLNPVPAARSRYADVAAEFKSLGPQAFGEKYYTLDIDDRIARVRSGVLSPDDAKRRQFGPSSTNALRKGFHRIPTLTGDDAIVEIHWIEGEGWTFSELDNSPAGVAFDHRPRFEVGYILYNWTAPDRFRSSQLSLRAAYNNYGQAMPSLINLPPKLQFTNEQRALQTAIEDGSAADAFSPEKLGLFIMPNPAHPPHPSLPKRGPGRPRKTPV